MIPNHALAVLLLAAAFWGYRLAPFDPLETDFAAKLTPPGKLHPFGTDNVGRDVLSRILYGAHKSFALTFLMIGIVSVLGTVIGVVSGYFGGAVDTVMMRFTDVLLAFPDTVFAIAIVGMMGPGLLHTVLAWSAVWWTKYARMTRGMTAVIREKDYIEEARFGGAGTARILTGYIIPNLLPQVIVMATVDIGGMMLALAEQFGNRIAVMYLGEIVEILKGENLTAQAIHPYTRALLDSVFSIHTVPEEPIKVLPGEPPSLTECPRGCGFSNRCKATVDQCRFWKPELVEIEDGHWIKCFLH